MAFSRDDLAAYESQPQTQVAETPKVIAPAATEPEPSQSETAASEDSPSADASDQTESGGETSDDNSSESSTEGADESGEAGEGETEGETTSEGETESAGQTAQKQSRAFKRIQELNAKALEAADLAEGYKEFGKLTAEQLKAAREELAELRAKLGGGKPASEPTAPSAAVADKLGPMPKLTDPDVNFDPDILAEKQEQWMKKSVQLSVAEALKQTTEKTQVNKAVDTFKTRVETFEKSTPDWKAKVGNPELPKLNPAAQAVIVKAELGPQIVYHLATNIPEAKRIAALPPEDQVMEMGVIKRDLELKKAAPKTGDAPVTGAKTVVKKSVSQAPPPPTAIPAGKRSLERDLTDPGLGMDDFARRHREAKNNARLAARKMRGLN